MKRILLSLFSVIFWLLGYGQNSLISYTEKYKLDFNVFKKDTVSYVFLANSAYAQNVGHMSIQTKDYNFGEQFIPSPYYRSMRTVMRRRILLPELPDKKTGSISLGVKGNELKQLTMRIQGLDYRESVLFNDTLSFVPDTVYSNLQGDFPLEGVEMLDITFDIEGNENRPARVVYSGLGIKVDGKPINDMPFREIPEVMIDEKDIISLSDESGIPFDKIKELRGKKIVCLSESLHGHKDVEGCAFRLMEESIHAMGCRTLVIEMPMEMSLFCNRFISDTSFVLPATLLDKPGFKKYVPLLEKLRLHNDKCSPGERVMLLGMDYNTSLGKDNHSLTDLFDFLCSLNIKQPTKETDRFSLMLYDNKPDEALGYLRSHRKKLEEALTGDELKCMEHILSFSLKLSEDPTERLILRDSMMAENVAFIEQTFAADENRNIVIYGHSLHLNRLSYYPFDSYRSAGSYLQEKYGQLYSSFLLVTDCGNLISNSPMFGPELVKLQYPCNGSIESALAHTSKTSCYLPMTEKNDCLAFSRLLGNPSHSYFQFYPFNLYQRYDGVFYVKAQKALLEVVGGEPKSNEEKLKVSMEKAKEAMSLLKKRKSLADEIRKRCEGVDKNEASSTSQKCEVGASYIIAEMEACQEKQAHAYGV